MMQIQDLLTTNYFAYGANTVSDIMKTRCPSARLVGVGVLPGYTLTFRKFSSIQPARGHNVEGVVWNISKIDLRQLDKFERVPVNYVRTQHLVRMLTGDTLLCWAYEMTPCAFEGQPIDSEYVEKLRKGRAEHGIGFGELERALDIAGG